jgi:hypothetical protein
MGHFARQSPGFFDELGLVDSTPVECARSRQTVKRGGSSALADALADAADYGYCASHSRFFFGFYWTAKDILTLQRHGARTLRNLRVRLCARFVALTAAISLNRQLGRPGSPRRPGTIRVSAHMLAYLFWHQAAPDATRDEYERRLIEFHAGLERSGIASAAFRLERLPFAEDPGYEDWYLVEDWAALGALGQRATEGSQGGLHDALAGLAGEGWGGVYALARGKAQVPERVRWADKPRGESYESFLEHEPADAIWQRQLVLGPAPELCLSVEHSADRRRVWPR